MNQENHQKRKEMGEKPEKMGAHNPIKMSCPLFSHTRSIFISLINGLDAKVFTLHHLMVTGGGGEGMKVAFT